jgi:tRNA1(Val) A37 N6-methylase TrmN6
MSVPDTILQLVENFEIHRCAYLSQDYNEAQVRLEFIDPFFEALGWDMFNKQSYAFAYKDVIHEDAIHVGGATKAPDYAFRIGGTRKFFVEAKKPAVNLKDAISPAYQLRRYAWSAKLPLSILTDFEEFTVYDCRLKPTLTDKPSTGRIQLLTYRDYPTHWDEIFSVFSREAVLKGSFDQYAESATGKHGTAEVDHAFLAEIERWRDLLAHNIALRNPSLSQRDLNYAVQMTIDRLIFLRICEDRGIEFYGQLQALLNGTETYSRLCQLYRNADDRYNSGLFHFRAEKGQADTPDTLSLGLALDDKPLKDILANLYYPESPYEFSVLPADILGQVYEQFLGKVIRLTSAHHAVVEDKPEVKKAGGVFYTPTFIVDYIVKHSLGDLLQNKHPGEVGLGRGAPIRVLDMACGSGSFLLGAYQHLLDWYLNTYTASEPEKYATGRSPQLVQVSHGEWRLTTSERKRILLDHIYGVDIDPQAVEVTKLSLLLKVLEGESQDTVGKQLSLFHQRALPDLGQNIKCGNSLIGPDFYSAQQSNFLDPEEQYRINAFDWQHEYAHVFASYGGFDVIIGNPPYRMLQPHNTEKEILSYLRKQYVAAEYKLEMFHMFLQKSISILSEGGYHGFIVPATILNNVYAEPLRKWIRERCCINMISVANKKVFENADVHTAVLLFTKQQNQIIRQKNVVLTTTQLNEKFTLNPQEYSQILQGRFSELPGNIWNILI